MLSVGLAGKPNSGKSTFFKAATLVEVDIANYPFTTIDANHGVSYVRVPCPCKELGIKEGCGRCKDGQRFIAIELIDVAGLVPDAHLGKGLGNEFLDALRVAEAVIHVLDASGGTDRRAIPSGLGNHDPVSDVKFLEYEISMWLNGILKRNWDKLMRNYKGVGGKPEQVLIEQMAGAGVSDSQVRRAVSEMKKDLGSWKDEDVLRFAGLLARLQQAHDPGRQQDGHSASRECQEAAGLEGRAGNTGERVSGDCASHGREGGADQVQARRSPTLRSWASSTKPRRRAWRRSGRS